MFKKHFETYRAKINGTLGKFMQEKYAYVNKKSINLFLIKDLLRNYNKYFLLLIVIMAMN